MSKKFSDEKLGGFKEWLEDLEIDTEIFTEDDYKTVFLFSAFNQFQQEVRHYKMLEQRMKEQGITPEQLENGEVDPNELLNQQPKKKKENKIITPDSPSNVVNMDEFRK